MQLYEKYRPKSLDDVIGQPKAVQVIKRLIQNGVGGRCFWISGASGTGKTTLARIIADHIADKFYVQEFDSADQLSVSAIDKIEQDMHHYAPGKGGRCFIVNESHSLRAPVIRRLLGILERIPGHIVFVFTTTRAGQEKLFDDQIDSHPLLSRCIRIQLTGQGLSKAFAESCRNIATVEGLNGKSIESYVRLAARCKNNCRMMLQAIESGEMM